MGDTYKELRNQVLSTTGCKVNDQAISIIISWQAASEQGGQEMRPVAKVVSGYSGDPETRDSFALEIIDLSGCKIGYKLYTHPQPTQQWEPSGIEYDRAIHHNPDAKAWADLFMQTFPHCGADPETMHGWFANAMMAMYDHLKNSQPAPQGSVPEWIKCSERLPTYEDAPFGQVWVWHDGPESRVTLDDYIHLDRLGIDLSRLYWMPTGLKRPKPPAEQEGE